MAQVYIVESRDCIKIYNFLEKYTGEASGVSSGRRTSEVVPYIFQVGMVSIGGHKTASLSLPEKNFIPIVISAKTGEMNGGINLRMKGLLDCLYT